MRIDRTHLGWMWFTLIATIGCGVAYAAYAAAWPGGPSGASWPGLAFGVAAALLMTFAGIVGARKKLLRLRVGSLAAWTRGHLWLGLLSLPLALYHAAFSFGSTLTTVLMTLTIIVVASGVIGAILQHLFPAAMTSQVERETTYEHIPRTLALLRCEAYELVWAACGGAPAADGEPGEIQQLVGRAPQQPRKPIAAGSVVGQAELAQFYCSTVAPYLRRPGAGGSPLASAIAAPREFERVRPEIDPSLHDTLSSLEEICEQARQAAAQAGLHRWLHGWLFVHVPLSMALLLLMVVHAVMALYY
jgi:hypothetical protein